MYHILYITEVDFNKCPPIDSLLNTKVTNWNNVQSSLNPTHSLTHKYCDRRIKQSDFPHLAQNWKLFNVYPCGESNPVVCNISNYTTDWLCVNPPYTLIIDTDTFHWTVALNCNITYRLSSTHCVIHELPTTNTDAQSLMDLIFINLDNSIWNIKTPKWVGRFRVGNSGKSSLVSGSGIAERDGQKRNILTRDCQTGYMGESLDWHLVLEIKSFIWYTNKNSVGTQTILHFQSRGELH